jgi:hypothetical protein
MPALTQRESPFAVLALAEAGMIGILIAAASLVLVTGAAGGGNAILSASRRLLPPRRGAGSGRHRVVQWPAAGACGTFRSADRQPRENSTWPRRRETGNPAVLAQRGSVAPLLYQTLSFVRDR